MTEKRDLNANTELELPYADTAELKSNQSVRATFKLSQNTILALNIVSSQLGIKQKSLFDHLIADTDALETIARKIRRTARTRHGNLEGVQKTYVISRKTLSILQQMAKAYEAPRDALVEFSIRRLKPVIEQEKEKLEVRRKIVANLEAQLDRQKELLSQAIDELGADDAICEQLSIAVNKLENAYLSILAFVKKSEKITGIRS